MNMECIGWGASINCCIKFNYKGRHAVRVRTKQIMIRMCENTDHVGMKGGMLRKQVTNTSLQEVNISKSENGNKRGEDSLTKV